MRGCISYGGPNEARKQNKQAMILTLSWLRKNPQFQLLLTSTYPVGYILHLLTVGEHRPKMFFTETTMYWLTCGRRGWPAFS